MKNLLPVLVLLAGLGSSISLSQGAEKVSAFDLYIAKTRAGQSEPALRRLASQCGVALSQSHVRFGEQIQWVGSAEDDPHTAEPDWAYEVRWTTQRKKYFKTNLERFVTNDESPISRPHLGAKAPKTLGLIPETLRWSDLKLPDEMLH